MAWLKAAHISNTPFELVDYTRSKGIEIEDYSPLGHGEILDNAEIAEMAKRYGVGVPQLAIRYCLQLGFITLPKTQTPAHMRSNADLDFEIEADDMETLKSIEPIDDYGDASEFPVYQKKARAD